MLRHQRWLDAFGDLADAIKMDGVQALGAAERQADAVQRYWKIATHRFETPDRRAAAHIVFGVDFHEGHIGRPFEHCLMVLEAQPDPGSRGDRVAGTGCRRGHRRSVLRMR